MITPGSRDSETRRRPELGRSMHLQVGRSYGELVLPVSGHELRDLTEPPRCGVVQYPMRTFPAS